MAGRDAEAGEANRNDHSTSRWLRRWTGRRPAQGPRQPWRVEGAEDRDLRPRPERAEERSAWTRFWWLWLVLLVVNWILSSVLLAPQPRPMVAYTFFLAPPGQESPLGSDGLAQATKDLLDHEVRRIVDECHEQAVATLVAHRAQLDRLAQALLAKETLDEDEAYTAAGVARDSAPGALARTSVPGIPPRSGDVVPVATD